jgi:hypothetical protein
MMVFMLLISGACFFLAALVIASTVVRGNRMPFPTQKQFESGEFQRPQRTVPIGGSVRK